MIFMLCRFWGMHTWCNHFHILPATLLLQLFSLPELSAKAKVKEKRPIDHSAFETLVWCLSKFSELWGLESQVKLCKWKASILVQNGPDFGSFLSFLSSILTDVGAFSMWTRFFRTPPSRCLYHTADAVAVAHMEVRCDRGFIGFILNGPFQQIGICDRGQNIMVPCVVTHNDRSLQDSPQDCQRILTVLLSLQWFRAYREEFRIFVAIATCIAAGFIM